MSEGSSFKCSASGRKYAINSEVPCHSSGVAYPLGCNVYGDKAPFIYSYVLQLLKHCLLHKNSWLKQHNLCDIDSLPRSIKKTAQFCIAKSENHSNDCNVSHTII